MLNANAIKFVESFSTSLQYNGAVLSQLSYHQIVCFVYVLNAGCFSFLKRRKMIPQNSISYYASEANNCFLKRKTKLKNGLIPFAWKDKTIKAFHGRKKSLRVGIRLQLIGSPYDFLFALSCNFFYLFWIYKSFHFLDCNWETLTISFTGGTA